MSENEVNLLATTDAKVWAEEWYRIFQKPDLLPDGDYVGWMISWFASAFAAQEFIDTKRIAELQAEVARLRGLNVGLTRDFNAMLIKESQTEDRAEAAEAALIDCNRVANVWADKAQAAEAKLRVVNELKPLTEWDVEKALAEDDSLLFISYDELRVKLDELEALLK